MFFLSKSVFIKKKALFELTIIWGFSSLQMTVLLFTQLLSLDCFSLKTQVFYQVVNHKAYVSIHHADNLPELEQQTCNSLRGGHYILNAFLGGAVFQSQTIVFDNSRDAYLELDCVPNDEACNAIEI